MFVLGKESYDNSSSESGSSHHDIINGNFEYIQFEETLTAHGTDWQAHVKIEELEFRPSLPDQLETASESISQAGKVAHWQADDKAVEQCLITSAVVEQHLNFVHLPSALGEEGGKYAESDCDDENQDQTKRGYPTRAHSPAFD
jgi:hypothetical protein